MVNVRVYSGGSVSSTDVDASRFGERVLGRTLKDAVVMYEANARAGTVKTRTRGEVSGPNKKLWRQKHTGRARMGTKKSPIWRGGGVTFGPRPRDYTYRMPRKARRAALKNAIYTKLRDGELAIADGWPSEAPSTKAACAILDALDVRTSTLVVVAEHDRNVYLSLRNVPQVDVCPVSDLNARRVLLRRNLIVTPDALSVLQSGGLQASEGQASEGQASEERASEGDVPDGETPGAKED